MVVRRWFVGLLVGVLAAGGVAAQPLLPGDAVASCYSEVGTGSVATDGDVLAQFHLQNPPGNAGVWGAPVGRHWKRSEFGGHEIFGIAFDEAPKPNIYVTPTSFYRSQSVYAQSAAGSAQVYKIDGTTFNVSPCGTNLDPLNTQASLGNIAYDSAHRRLFVSNLRTGQIHILDTNCSLKGSFDPVFPAHTPSVSTAGYAPLGERVLGVGLFRNRLYLSRWLRDVQSGPDNEIWSIGLDSFGTPVGSLQRELTLVGERMPVTDIEFAPDGRMVLAQRGLNSQPQVVFTVPHQSHLLEFRENAGQWVPSGTTYEVGQPPNLNQSAAGGADFICPEPTPRGGGLVATGDALVFGGGAVVYGLQVFPPGVSTTANSLLVDLDGSTAVVDKTEIGDVDVYNTCDRQCSELVNVQVSCVTDRSGVPIPGRYNVSFQIRNRSQDTVYNAFLVGLPGATTTHFPFPNGLAPGAVSPVLSTLITGGTAGQQLTFQVTLHDRELNECCATRHTITLPRCDCAQVLGPRGPSCRFRPANSYNLGFSLQNLNPSVSPAFLLVVPETPSTATITPAVSAFSGNSQNVSLTIGNVGPGQQVCFLASLHTADFERCCSIRHCVTTPRCFVIDLDDPISIGDTVISFDEAGLVLEDPAGNPGCTLPLLPATTSFEVTWSEADTAELPVGGLLEQAVQGLSEGVERTLARTSTTKTGTGAELRTSFPAAGASRHRFEFFLAGERTGVVTGVRPDAPAICNGCGTPKITTDAHFSVLHWPGVSASQENAEPCSGPGFTADFRKCVFAGYTFKTENRFGIPNVPGIFLADEVRVFPEDGEPRADALTSVSIQARGIPRLTLVDVGIQGDCNDNGIPDFDEIRTGAGLDLDRDGVLDECVLRPQPLAIDLSTGVDNGQPLAGGAEDADWRFVSPGPTAAARVVARPHAAWPAPLPGSRWVSVDGATGQSLLGVRFLHFERIFCLTSEARDLVLDLALRADDRASVRLNGRALAGPGGGFGAASPLAVRWEGAAGDGWFLEGTNRLEVEVRDPGGVVTGFDLTGSLRGSAGGVCLVP